MAKPTPKRAPKAPKVPPRTQVPAHLPALTPLELEAVQQRLTAAPNISTAGKAVVMQSLRAAANPNAESPDVVIKTLDADEKRAVKEAQAGYTQALNAPLSRGRARLMQMSADEWDKVIGQSGVEGE